MLVHPGEVLDNALRKGISDIDKNIQYANKGKRPIVKYTLQKPEAPDAHLGASIEFVADGKNGIIRQPSDIRSFAKHLRWMSPGALQGWKVKSYRVPLLYISAGPCLSGAIRLGGKGF